eukprot:CAMPEP_0182455314 /NCGR_PEP_ID=MMETSP1319-20130603/1532_1 /TAXON_ID=172717 /ORGANISM="Bolidomonas pacifica, Strain RCC208" /LENGTH=150 /DNA_ID=CAMNT_0024653359 /DNA_START=327 /DNA_END=775 /DNA_ORIENTATION=-
MSPFFCLLISILILPPKTSASRLSISDHFSFSKSFVSSLPCFTSHSRFCDPYRVLPSSSEAKLDAALASTSPTLICGNSGPRIDSVEIGVVILPRFNHLPPHSYPSPDSDEYDAFVRRAARTLAEAAHDEHGVGDDRPASCLGLLEKEGG